MIALRQYYYDQSHTIVGSFPWHSHFQRSKNIKKNYSIFNCNTVTRQINETGTNIHEQLV